MKSWTMDLVMRVVGWRGLGVGHAQMTASHLAVLLRFECVFNSLFRKVLGGFSLLLHTTVIGGKMYTASLKKTLS